MQVIEINGKEMLVVDANELVYWDGKVQKATELPDYVLDEVRKQLSQKTLYMEINWYHDTIEISDNEDKIGNILKYSIEAYSPLEAVQSALKDLYNINLKIKMVEDGHL